MNLLISMIFFIVLDVGYAMAMVYHQKIPHAEIEEVDDGDNSLDNRSLKKTELCKNFYEIGSCFYGDNCGFAHSENELVKIRRNRNYKTRDCNNFSKGDICPFGERCHFKHQKNDSIPIDILLTILIKKGFESNIFSEGSSCPFGKKCHGKHNSNLLKIDPNLAIPFKDFEFNDKLYNLLKDID